MNNLPKILFVDDESLVLHALKRALRPLCSECECKFAVGPHEALELLKKESFTIVVSDMRMPEIDGALLLQKFKSETPDTVRVILSGQANADTVVRSLLVTHQYMSKPINTDYLQKILRSLLQTDAVLKNPLLRRKISQFSAIPTLQSTMDALWEMVEADSIDHEKLTLLAKKDIGLLARLLHISGLSSNEQRRCTSFNELMSTCSAQMLLLAFQSKDLFTPIRDDSDLGLLIQNISSHSIKIAEAVTNANLYNSLEEKSERFIAALLHDFGKILIAHLFEDIVEPSLEAYTTRLSSTSSAEEKLLGSTHAEIGAYLAAIWGFDESVVSLIQNHNKLAVNSCDNDSSLKEAHLTLSSEVRN